MATCPNCGNTTGEGAVFCDQCGTRLPQPEEAAPPAPAAPAGGSVICPACGAGNVPGEAFCDYCGSPLEPPVPTVLDVPELEPVSQEAELEVPVEPPVPAAEAPPVQEPVTPPEVEPVEPSSAEEAVPVCPACGAAVSADEAFCAACGASLALAPIPPEPVPAGEPALPAGEPTLPAGEPTLPAGEPTPSAAEPTPPVVEPTPPPPPVEETVCPACGTEIEPGDAFCSACGYALKAVPAPSPAPAVKPAPAAVGPSPAGPRLVVVDSGAEIPLPAGDEILVGREDPVSGIYPDVDMTPHGGEEGGISRQHARITKEGGSYFVEDLDSTNFTFVNKQKLAPKTRQPVADGDEVRFGRVATVLRTGS